MYFKALSVPKRVLNIAQSVAEESLNTVQLSNIPRTCEYSTISCFRLSKKVDFVSGEQIVNTCII